MPDVNDRVFISYSRHDVSIADAVCERIEAGGRQCWIAPRDIEPSSEWAEQIIDGINASSLMVLIFSSWSNQSPQVRREVERATHRDMPVIPFRIENVLPAKSLEYFLSTQHWFDAYEGPVDAHVDRLCRLVRTLGTRRGASHSAGMRDSAPPAGTNARSTPAADRPAGAHREDDLAFVSRELARHIGPIARFLVQRASATTADRAALISALAAELDDPTERGAFVRACRRQTTGPQ